MSPNVISRCVQLVAATLAVLVASHVGIEAAGLRFFQPEASESIATLDAFRLEPQQVDVVLLGSSRLRRAAVVPVIENVLARTTGQSVRAFNLSQQAGETTAYYVIVRDLLRDERVPRLLVLGLGAYSLNAHGARRAHALEHLASPVDWLGPLGPSWRRGDEVERTVSAAFRAPGTLLQLWRRRTPSYRATVGPILERGGSLFAPLEPVNALPDADTALRRLSVATASDAVHTRRARAVAHRARGVRQKLLRSYDPEGPERWALEALLDVAAERDLTVLVLDMPVGRAFGARAYLQGEYEAYRKVVRDVCAHRGVRLVDLNQGSWRPADVHFSDGDHLTAEAAQLYSVALAERVLAPELRHELAPSAHLVGPASLVTGRGVASTGTPRCRSVRAATP